jgi:hypothetical protein
MVEHLGWMHRGAGAIGDSERERGSGLRRLREAGSGRRSPGSHQGEGAGARRCKERKEEARFSKHWLIPC